MFNPRKIGLAALAALLVLPAGAVAVYAASTSQNGAAITQAHPSAAAPKAHDAETADDNEPKGPDTDNVQEGPGNTAEAGPENEAPGTETPDKNEGAESKTK